MTHPKPAAFRHQLQQILTPSTTVLLVVSLLTPFSAFLLYPFLTIYFTHVLGFSVGQAGLLLSVRFLSSAVLGFASAWLSGRIGLVRTYVLAGLVTGAAVFSLAETRNVAAIVLLLVVLGVSASAVNAMVRSLAGAGVPVEVRGTLQTYIHWLQNVGMAAALPVSADVLRGGFSQTPFIVTAVGYVAVALLVGFAFGRMASRETGLAKAKGDGSSLFQILRDDRSLRYLMAAFVLFAMVEMQFESSVPLDLSYHFRHGVSLYGTLGVIEMAVVFFLQIVVGQWLSRQPSPWIGYAGILLSGGLLVGGLWQTVSGWTIAIILLGLGEVFSVSLIMGLFGVLPPDNRQGSYFSLFFMAQGLATFLAYAVGGGAYQFLGPGWLFGLSLPVSGLAAYCYRSARRFHLALST